MSHCPARLTPCPPAHAKRYGWKIVGGWIGMLLHTALSAQTPGLAATGTLLSPLTQIRQISQITPITQGSPAALPAAWRVAVLPASYGTPATGFDSMTLDGEPSLRIQTERSYGSLVHDFRGPVPGLLQWQWRLDKTLPDADIATRSGDDSALKVCVMFDQPLADMPLLERASLQLARAASGEALPAATLCYLWDSRYPAGRSGANAYSARVRYIVLQGPDTPLGQWVTQQRDVTQDFRRLFGRESPQLPPVIAVAVGADSDNTKGRSLAYLRRLQWLK